MKTLNTKISGLVEINNTEIKKLNGGVAPGSNGTCTPDFPKPINFPDLMFDLPEPIIDVLVFS